MSQGSHHSPTPKLGASNTSRPPHSSRFHQDSTQALNLQSILNEERSRFLQLRQNYQIQLSNQKKIRLEIQNKLIRLKDEVLAKTILIAELEFKQGSILQDRDRLSIENEGLRNEAARLQSTYTDKILDLQQRLNSQTKNFDDYSNQYAEEFQKFKADGRDFIESLNFEYQRKITGLEERLKVVEGARKELESENKRLNDTVLTNQLDFDAEIREVSKRLRTEDLKKSQMASRTFEERYRGLEQNKEAMSRKNKELMRTVQEKEKLLSDVQAQKHQQILKLREEIDSLTSQNHQLRAHYDSIKQQLKQHSRGLLPPTSDNSLPLRQQIDSKNQELDSLKQLLRKTRSELSEQRVLSEKKEGELLGRVKSLETQSKRYKEQYTKICETLKLKINETINVVSKGK